MVTTLKYFLISTLIIFSILSSVSIAKNFPPTFDGAEHISLGDSVKLHFDNSNEYPPAQNHSLLHLPNGLILSYGDILAFGDFYGSEQGPISKAENKKAGTKRFLQAFESFASDPTVITEANKILDLLHNEKDTLEKARKRGEDTEKIAKKFAAEHTKQFNCLTGGGCSDLWYLSPGRYLKLARVDFDHFGHNAWKSYEIGHTIALQYAKVARQNKNPQQLEVAYAINAFACHFLSDRFAAGHMRTPRTKLTQAVTPSLTGSLLAGFMHIEENAYGLHVHNLNGDQWIAYGDHGYYTEKNKFNREILKRVLQLSADQVYEMYKDGLVRNYKSLEELIPFVDELSNHTNQDISPLFYWDKSSQKLLRRKDITNVYDRNWTDQWWGWSTLILLSKYYGIPPEAQGNLATSNFALKALNAGLITDKNLIQYLNSKSSSMKN